MTHKNEIIDANSLCLGDKLLCVFSEETLISEGCYYHVVELDIDDHQYPFSVKDDEDELFPVNPEETGVKFKLIR